VVVSEVNSGACDPYVFISTPLMDSEHERQSSFPAHSQKHTLTQDYISIIGWFGVAVTAFVASTKLSYVESGLYWDWRRPLTGLPSQYLSRPLRPTQPGHPSVGRCSEYRKWFRPSLGSNGASEVTTLQALYKSV